MGRATEKQIDFATAIAEELCLDLPDFDDWEETSDFISDNVDDFYYSKRESNEHYLDADSIRFKKWVREQM